jgi:3',5'-nucleoside bisphosphate phosphatase
MTDNPPTFDLQSHSVHSDGELTASEVVVAAAAAGVEVLALSDHDTVDGVPEASEAAARLGVRLVPAVEVSTIDPGGQDLHVLGYRVEVRDTLLRERLRRYREEREQRASVMAVALRELGFQLDETILSRRRADGKSIGRPHLAQAVVSHPANTERLAAEAIEEPSAFLEAYLIEGRSAFRPRIAPSVAEAIEVIHQAGGVAVWAHPFWDIDEPGKVVDAIDRFVESGLDGVECFYPTHTREQAELLADCCAERGLLSTGSSDFHGFQHRLFSQFRAFSTFGRMPVLGSIAT